MPETIYRGRRAATLENGDLRVTVLREGGHIAEILEKSTGVNPLWTPPWPSIEPSQYSRGRYPEYGADAEARLLAGIMGHNLCLDIFGGPSPEEAAAGLTAHGESSVAPYEIEESEGVLRLGASFPLAQLRFERTLELHGHTLHITEVVENLCASDRPIAWTQHVTLGPPFLERGVTQFRAPATRSQVFESEFGSAAYLPAGAVFDWPNGPRKDGGCEDLRVFNSADVSSGYTAHWMDPQQDETFFAAFHPGLCVAIAYVWKQQDFPWLGIWEENHSRANTPWNGQALTRGMEFGVSPFPESRREMVARGSLFGVPAYRWLPANGRLEVRYRAMAWRTDRIPEALPF